MSGRRAALLCAAGALLLTASYPPFDLPALSFLAIAPAVVLLRSAVDQGDPGRAFRWGLAYGAATQGLLLYWIAIALWHFTPLSALGYFVTVVVLTVYTGGLFWLVARAATVLVTLRGGIHRALLQSCAIRGEARTADRRTSCGARGPGVT